MFSKSLLAISIALIALMVLGSFSFNNPQGFHPSHRISSGSTATKPSVLSGEMPLYAARLPASLGMLRREASRLAELPS